MRLLAAAAFFGLFVSSALAQTPPPVTGDFDGDGAGDTAAWEPGRQDGSWRVVARLSGQPGRTFTLVEVGGSDPGQIEVRPRGAYDIREFGRTSQRSFANDVVVLMRRGELRGLKYWSGQTFVGTWLVD